MASESHSTDMEREVTCPICLDCLTDPVTMDCGHNFCRDCINSYCEAWKELGELECPVCKAKIQEGNFQCNWQLANVVEKIKQMPHNPVRDICLRHKKKLHLFCKDDEELVCWICERSPEHRGHKALILKEAARPYKNQIHSCLKTVRNERDKIQAYKVDAEKESHSLLERTESERQKTVAEFRQLHQFLDEQEELLLAQMEEAEKEITREMDECLARLSRELSLLESLIWEMEEKIQQPDVDLLLDIRSTLQRYEKDEQFEKPVVFPPELKWKIWDCWDICSFLKGIIKQFKDMLVLGCQLQKANVTLDPDTAHPQLILSEDLRSVRMGDKAQDLPNNPERFDFRPLLLGSKGFTAGRHYWEVDVGREEGWAVGVTRKSVRRKGSITFSPEGGIWAVEKWAGEHYALNYPQFSPLSLSSEPKRIRVYLNYDERRVTFYDADTAVPLYTFSEASFSGQIIFPFFWVRNKAHLKLFP
ncbi:tripartite motif-containing protein 10-like [Eublepharis macularius]|uniref:Tripartite motif-containing protein 10-like n=1 Tax=Eublepharis macularius TaxID=481883 RepID=A0AA97J691_EUBMA|nr:tripartite motif-containing protein 10-like [Eublepharis macularius]